jgi:hypothetical protein
MQDPILIICALPVTINSMPVNNTKNISGTVNTGIQRFMTTTTLHRETLGSENPEAVEGAVKNL